MVHSRDVTRDDAGRPLRQFGVMQDITELWQAGEELRAAGNARPRAKGGTRGGIRLVHRRSRERNRWSPDLEAMYGLEPGTFDRTYQGWKKLVHPDDWPSVKLAIERTNRVMSRPSTGSFRDGSVHWLQAKGRMFFDAEGRTHGRLHDRRHGSAAPRRRCGRKTGRWRYGADELARVAPTTLGELTTSIAHEVSQPLGAMVASAGACVRWLAADPPAMAEARAALDNIVADGSGRAKSSRGSGRHQGPGAAQGQAGYQSQDRGGPRPHGPRVTQPRHPSSDRHGQDAARRGRGSGPAAAGALT